MATWLILVVAALVLAVIGATTAAAWLLVIGALLLVVGLFWAATGRNGRAGSPDTAARGTRRGER
jgi:hypothetical protein